MQPPTIDDAVSGLRFLFNATLDRPAPSRRPVAARYTQDPPTVLNVGDIGRRLEAARGPEFKAALGIGPRGRDALRAQDRRPAGRPLT